MRNLIYYRQTGFTLIELLVVIAVMGVLATVVLVSVNPLGQIAKARDAERLARVGQIQKALESYKLFANRYPSANVSGNSCSVNCAGWEVACDDVPFIRSLVEAGDLKAAITDPSMNGSPACQNFKYYRYAAGTSGCDVSKGAFYVLGIVDMESSSRPYPQSPGWSCPTRNWQGEFDWVTGGFENE